MIQVHFETTQVDFQAFQQFVASSLQGGRGRSGIRWPYVALGFGFGLAIAFGASASELPIHVPTAIGSAIFFTAVFAYIRWRVARAATPSERGAFLGPRWTSLDETGVREESANHNSVTRWPGVLAIEETPAHVFLMIDRFAGYIVPKRSFAAPAALDEFLSFARQRAAS